MTKFESAVKVIPASQNAVYEKLSSAAGQGEELEL